MYYWFGEDKRAGGAAGHTHAIACYSSRDLYNWKNEGNVAPEIGPQGSLFAKYPLAERPKVVFNARTGKYVMWAHMENAHYSAATAGVATADKVTGPYKFVKFIRVNNDNNRDSTLYKDDDGKAYFIYWEATTSIWTSRNSATTTSLRFGSSTRELTVKPRRSSSTIDEAFDPRPWVNGNTYTVNSIFRLPEDLRVGNCDLRIAFVDEAGTPRVRLGIAGADSAPAIDWEL